MAKPEPPPLDTDELRLLASRERDRLTKQAQRARAAQERATVAVAPNASGYRVGKMPGRMSELRRWLRRQQDAYSRRDIGPVELAEVRRSFTAMLDSYKAGALVRQSLASMKSAEAQERMATVLASVEHGGAAILMLERLREGLTSGPRRPLPGLRTLPALPPQGDSAS